MSSLFIGPIVKPTRRPQLSAGGCGVDHCSSAGRIERDRDSLLLVASQRKHDEVITVCKRGLEKAEATHRYLLHADLAHAYMYAQRTADGRIALGGRGVPYRFGSRTDNDGRTQEATIAALREILLRFFPATAGVASNSSVGATPASGQPITPRTLSIPVCLECRPTAANRSHIAGTSPIRSGRATSWLRSSDPNGIARVRTDRPKCSMKPIPSN